ncbi:TniQ family protein [Methylomonas sp. OY6]|uniref:TniQ family protein n=1 Tax=Methylomonas defluvii TaxID=3045149 RepID=A0ABU4ULU7_9GAMM|nr:TniQ family protein [Methylomonas sp. OY6]MDX8130383.1 TniQ family protein [Methylomonas sp. OY6]
MLIPHSQYPVRQTMKKGESLAGYLYRFQGGNGHRIARRLEHTLGALYRGTATDAPPAAFDTLQMLLGTSTELDRTWWLRKRRLPKCSNGHENSRPGLDVVPVRFCVLCLSECGFDFALWELPQIAACPVHQIRLYERCVLCGKTFSWSDLMPDWFCACGQSITNAPITLASRNQLLFAQLLAGSEDVDLPSRFNNCDESSISKGYTLSEVYAGLEWGSRLRKALCRDGHRSHKPIQSKWSHRPYWSDDWIVVLIMASPDELRHRILRILARRFRGHKDLLCSVSKLDWLYRMMQFVDTGSYGYFQMKIQVVVAQMLADYQLKLPISSAVFYNPWISPTRRYENQTRLMHWWANLSKRIGDLDPEMLRYQQTTVIPPIKYGKREYELELVDILNRLSSVAFEQADLTDCRALIYWWRIPKELRELRSPSDVLQQLGLHLTVIPDYELYFVGSLVRLACPEKPA